MKLYGSIVEITLEALDFIPYFKSTSNIQVLDKEFNFAKNLMQAYLN
jgi:hypothetical protein